MTQILVLVDSVTWTPVVCPIHAKTMILDNNESGGGDVKRRIESGVASTQKLIPFGMQAVWRLSDGVGGGFSHLQNASFAPGQTVCYLQSVTGSFNVAVEFIE